MKTALTIGFFDGVHIGHQAILKRLRQHPHATILTFSNHPLSAIHPPAPELLISLEEKLALLKPYADRLIVLPFTPEFAATTFEELLSQYDLSHLILGQGSAFGKNRQGNETNVRKFAKEHGFTVEYLPKVYFQNEPVSSSRIRRALANGDSLLAQQLLGRL